MNPPNIQADEGRLQQSRNLWNDAAASFDDEADHGLRDPHVRAAWAALLHDLLPATTGIGLDIGCGTGSLSLLLAAQGYTVTGIDLSPAMLAIATQKAEAAGHSIAFQPMDAAFPTLPPHHFDVIVCRHLLWALSPLEEVLARWVTLLKPSGRLLLIEGYWHNAAGLHAPEIVAALPTSLHNVAVHPLSDNADLWGDAVTDERYAITADAIRSL